MADYYPLLAKAVSGLPQPSSEEMRRVIYERARSALLKQLRSIAPPIADVDLARESSALDEAVAKLEAEIAAQAMAAQTMAAQTDAPELDARQNAVLDPQDLDSAADQTTADQTAADVQTPSNKLPAQKNAPHKPKAAGFTFRPPEPGHGPSPAETTDSLSSEAEASLAPALADAVAPEDDAPRPREMQRPIAPQPSEPKSRKYTYWIFGAVFLILISAFAFTAYKLRGGSDSLAHFKTPVVEPAEPAAAGKIIDRVGDESQANAKKKAPPAPKTNEPTDEYSGNPSTPPQVAPSSSQPQSPVPIASRSVLVIQAPEVDAKVKKYEGNVIWRLENVSQGAGQPVLPVIHADVEIPDAKLKMTLDIIKNTDPTFAPSHMVKIRYTIGSGSDIQGVKQVGAPMMRREESLNGDQLMGAATQITENYYLIGLKGGDPEAKNLDLLKNRGWLDVPLISTNGRMAKITLEKGLSGDRIFNDAIAAWERQK